MVRRTIDGFHRDDDGDWVAELSCLHGQHVRHRPPFVDRAWVLTEGGRRERIDTDIDCPLCDRAELPSGLRVARTAGPFDNDTLPAGLRRPHQVGERTWGLLRVLAGSVDFRLETEPALEVHLEQGAEQAIPPQVPHVLTIAGPMTVEIDFLVAG